MTMDLNSSVESVADKYIFEEQIFAFANYLTDCKLLAKLDF